ncbi:MAG TPA: hypothetical protein VGN82_14255 [Bosea sp. (in: a-proteobacteria)]|jgi:hypothetical protein|uniref:hypothetical protein n=1 Tax=Bosea sp. (in: a-proteobacteria) TaxID=1871050 RepID=UPI002E153D1D|nr:hypothetical protein [Bosea sp. (in: a-proteobacteria)]
MIQIKTKVTLRRRGNLANHIAKIEKGVKGPKAVKVGFPKGKADADVVSIAIWNHLGTSRGIPPRPFITIAMYKSRREIRAALRKIAKGTVENGTPIAAQLPKLGAYGAGKIQDQIAANTPPPNAPSTIRQKGSSRTLIDTGRMRQSVTWEIDK